MPVALAPVGLTGHAIAPTARSRRRGRPRNSACRSPCRPCRSVRSRTWREATTKPFWFQVYTLKDDDFMQRLIDRARAAGCSAMVITVDLQMLGQRHKDLKNGLSAPPKLTVKSIANMMTKVALGAGDAGHQAAVLRQYRRSCQGRVGPVVAVILDGRGVRSVARLGPDRRS